MQDHDKTLITLAFIGAVIGLGKLLVSEEPLSVRVVIGRMILGSATSLLAGAALMKIPDIDPLALIGIACALGILGSSFIEAWLKNKARKMGD